MLVEECLIQLINDTGIVHLWKFEIVCFSITSVYTTERQLGPIHFCSDCCRLVSGAELVVIELIYPAGN